MIKLITLYTIIEVEGMEQFIQPENIVYSVSQINGLIKNLFEESFGQITIEGEISNYRPNSTGHLYFSLKDKDSQIGAVMFRFRASSLTFAPKDGILVRCKGQLSVYEPRGTYSINITSMELAGEGNMLLEHEENVS